MLVPKTETRNTGRRLWDNLRRGIHEQGGKAERSDAWRQIAKS